MIFLTEIVEFLDRLMKAERYQGKKDQNGVYIGSERPIKRLGLALEPWTGMTAWARDLDALFLHRPWRLEPSHLTADTGVFSYHLAFDETFTLGLNPRLAAALGMTEIEVYGEKEGRPIGMIGQIPAQDFSSFGRRVAELFGGHDAALAGPLGEGGIITRVAVVGGMNDKLVREAVAGGAEVYVSGEWREPARQAVRETGVGVILTGHRRSEEWGLGQLAKVIGERWPEIEVVTQPPDLKAF